MNNLFPERPFQFLDNPNPDKEIDMNNNCDQDDFCTCECCEEFYGEDPTVETNLTLLVQEAQLELYRIQRILAEEQLILTRAGKEFLENQTVVMKEVMEAFREVVKKANR